MSVTEQMQTRGPLLHGVELSRDSDGLQAVLAPRSWHFLSLPHLLTCLE